MARNGCARRDVGSARRTAPDRRRRVQVQAPFARRGRSRRGDLRNDDQAGREIHGNGGQRLRVVAVVAFDEEDESPFTVLLMVEAATA